MQINKTAPIPLEPQNFLIYQIQEFGLLLLTSALAVNSRERTRNQERLVTPPSQDPFKALNPG